MEGFYIFLTHLFTDMLHFVVYNLTIFLIGVKAVVLVSSEKGANGGFWSDSTAEILLMAPA